MRRPRLAAWQVLLAPAALLLLVFYVLPAAINLGLAFTDMDFSFDARFVGLESLARPLHDPAFPWVLRNTVIYVVATLTLMNIGLGLVLALLSTEVPDRIGGPFRTLWLLPRMTPSVVYVLIWFFLLDPTDYGLFNRMRGAFGASPYDVVTHNPWLFIVLLNGSVGASLAMVVFSSAIKSIPKELGMAARVDGASALQRIRHVTLPAIAWPVTFVTMYQTLSLLTSYEYILLATGGGPFYRTEVWSLYVFHNAISDLELGYGAALSVGLMAAGALITFLYWRAFRFGDRSSPPRLEVPR